MKTPFQLLHLIRHVFHTFLVTDDKATFADYDDVQNRALYTIKTLMTKLTKDYPNVLKQKLISVDLITEKKI